MTITYRKLDSVGDYTFGLGAGNFHVNNREAVGQAVLTRLRLIQGEWFLNLTEGVPYGTQVMGAGTIPLYDKALQAAILGTYGVTGIAEYASAVDPNTRRATISAVIDTMYGSTSVSTLL